MKLTNVQLRERLRKRTTPAGLHQWVNVWLGLNIPRVSVCPGHCAPFDYLRLAYFEPARDLVVWAPRGGGKTRLAAVATLLDLLHKPEIAVRILGGSLEQSLRMWEHLLPDIERVCPDLLSGKPRKGALKMKNGAGCAVLTQSERAVRGLRVQKLRCDEVEMFQPEIWEAAQLVTRTHKGVHGSIDALSTLHHPWGLMNKVIETAEASGKTVLRWCLLEVLERCPKERDCATCPLWDECKGVAKIKCNGFFSIDDAIRMKKRVGIDTWEAEMLCRRPSIKGCVFPRFDVEVHVRSEIPNFKSEISDFGSEISNSRSLSFDFGFSGAFVCLWIDTFADGTTFVLDEYVQEGRTVIEHLEYIQSKPYGTIKHVSCDPAGSSRNDQTAMSNVALLRRQGYVVKHRKSLIMDGLEEIRAALKPAYGPPRLFIHPRCTRLIKAMQAYRYPERGGEVPVKDGEHDHPVDALRYHYVNHGKAKLTPRGY